MPPMNEPDLSIPGHVILLEGKGGLPKVCVETAWSTAEIYLHGAHITHFQKKKEAPLLFMSAASEYAPGKPIRGGVPIIFPWFGGREGFPAHGSVRSVAWKMEETSLLADGKVFLRFSSSECPGFHVEFNITVGETLAMELHVRNSGGEVATFESCMHTYFQISSIHDLSIAGLVGATYLDTLRDTLCVEGSAPIRIAEEVDRIYFDTTATVEIADPGLGRRIQVRKWGSASTVVWNPWTAKAKRMPDFGDEEYPAMVCVESGNVRQNAITLAPGESATLGVELASAAL
jgi:glucose-6-phosphate 1-epimerase